MKNLLVLGAGRSAFSLIRYLQAYAHHNDLHLKVGDLQPEAVLRIADNSLPIDAFYFNVKDIEQCKSEVQRADLVISLLPATLHLGVAEACLEFGKNMATASYVSEGMKALHEKAVAKGLVFLNECGLDPGIDHMSAQKAIQEIKEEGAALLSFKSYAGGLISPEYDTNPWHYKFTWNPYNVVRAGMGTARFIQEGQYKYVPYQRLFSNTEKIHFSQLPEISFEAYPNRDSLGYREVFDLQNIPTLIRGTIRQTGFCEAWNALVCLGMTDDSYTIPHSQNLTYREFTNSFLKYDPVKSLEEKVAEVLKIELTDPIMHRLKWTGLFSNQSINRENGTPAQILQDLLEEKWSLDSEDKDMIVMQHLFEYEKDGKRYLRTSSLCTFGKDAQETAMAMTVGLPLAMACRLLIEGKIPERGVLLPITPSIYEPVLAELEQYGICFKEEIIELQTTEIQEKV